MHTSRRVPWMNVVFSDSRGFYDLQPASVSIIFNKLCLATHVAIGFDSSQEIE